MSIENNWVMADEMALDLDLRCLSNIDGSAIKSEEGNVEYEEDAPALVDRMLISSSNCSRAQHAQFSSNFKMTYLSEPSIKGSEMIIVVGGTFDEVIDAAF